MGHGTACHDARSPRPAPARRDRGPRPAGGGVGRRMRFRRRPSSGADSPEPGVVDHDRTAGRFSGRPVERGDDCRCAGRVCARPPCRVLRHQRREAGCGRGDPDGGVEAGSTRVRLPRSRRNRSEHRAQIRHRRALAGRGLSCIPTDSSGTWGRPIPRASRAVGRPTSVRATIAIWPFLRRDARIVEVEAGGRHESRLRDGPLQRFRLRFAPAEPARLRRRRDREPVVAALGPSLPPVIRRARCSWRWGSPTRSFRMQIRSAPFRLRNTSSESIRSARRSRAFSAPRPGRMV